MGIKDILRAKKEGKICMPWRTCSSDDFKKYYEIFHEGKARMQIQREDSKFYSALQKRNLLDEILPEPLRKNLKEWRSMTIKQLREYYKVNHEGKNRKHIQREDSKFYSALGRLGLLNEILPESLRKDWKSMTKEELIEYYKTHHKGKTRGRICNEDSRFYQILQRRKLLNEILPESILKDWKSMTIEQLREYYIKNHKGKGRRQIQREDSNFYRALQRRKLVDKLLPESILKDWKSMTKEQLRQYYEANHKGKPKIQILEEDLGFYQALRRRGLIDEILPGSIRTDDEYNQLSKSLTSLRTDLKTKKIKTHKEESIFDFGRCFEKYVGILLAVENKRVEHQYKLETRESFRLIDFYIGNKGYIALEDIVEELIEVKSGESITEHDKSQLEDILQQHKDGNNLTYVVYDKNSSLAKELEQRKIEVIAPFDLSAYQIVSDNINNLFSDKRAFKGFVRRKKVDTEQFEADLFSAYLWVKQQESLKEEVLNQVLDAVYKQDEIIKRELAQNHNITWLSIAQYNKESLKVFSKERGRHFDLELAKKKIQGKIRNLEKELAFYSGEYGDFILRERNFKKLLKLIENIPEGAARWGIPPFMLYHHEKKPKALIVYRENGTGSKYELNGVVKSNKRTIDYLVETGKIAKTRTRYFSTEGAIPI